MDSKPDMNGLRVLSLGYTLDLWDKPSEAFGDPMQGLTGYEDCMSYFALIAHSPHFRKLQPLQLAENFWAYPTNAYTPFDSWWRMFRTAKRLAAENPIDLLQVRESFFSGSVGYLLSRRLGIPLHVCVYGTNPFDPYWGKESVFHRLAAALGKAILRRADGIQCDGSLTARCLAEEGIPANRITVKPLVPGNLEDYLADERDPQLLDQLSANGRFHQFVLFVGRVDKQKNLALLLDAASRLADEHPGARFIIVGDGPQRRRLQEAARERGLSDNVLWVGPLSHHQVVKHMAVCHIFALPSLYEGFARVLMEAGMAGMPIVTTAVSGSDDAVAHGKNGYIVPVGDSTAFSNALSELLRHPERAAEMGRASRIHIQDLVARYSDPHMQVHIWNGVLRNCRRGL